MALKDKKESRVGSLPHQSVAVDDKPPFAPASAIELVVLPRRDNVQITIYNSADLTLIREKRSLTLKRGWNWLQFMWANTLIDPTSLSIEPQQQKDKITIQQLVFPARLKDLGRWLIRSEIEGQVPFKITYFTSGLSWRAFYMGTLTPDEQKMRLQAYVRVANNSGEDYENAQTRLLVGKVHQLNEIATLAKRQYPYDSPIKTRHAGIGGADYDGYLYFYEDNENVPVLGDQSLIKNSILDLRALKPKEIIKEGLSEYFLYTIEGTETIENTWAKRLQSFDAHDVNIDSLYKYDEQRWGNQTIRFIAFANDKDHNLGQTPIPNGNMKIYAAADQKGSLSYIGTTDIKYIPVNEKVELNLGPAQLVKVEPVLMEYKTDNYVVDGNGNICTHGYIYDQNGNLKSMSFGGYDELCTWKIGIINASYLPIEVEITRSFEDSYWNLEISDKNVSYQKYDAKHARFTIKLPPQSKQEFTYKVTIYHGWRREAMSEKKILN